MEIETLAVEVQRLRARNRLSTGGLILTLLVLCCYALGRGWNDRVGELLSPRCSTIPDDGGLHVSAMGDGPFVITHVVAVTQNGGRAIAPLPEPLGWVESGSHYLTLAELKKLRWYGVHGNHNEPVAFPTGATWRVLYLRPGYTRPAQESGPRD